MAGRSKRNKGHQGEVKHAGVVWPSRKLLHRIAPALDRELRGAAHLHRAAEKGRKEAQREVRTRLDLTARNRGIAGAMPRKGWLGRVHDWFRGRTGKG